MRRGHNVGTRDEIWVKICYCRRWVRKPFFKLMNRWLSVAHTRNTSEYYINYDIDNMILLEKCNEILTREKSRIKRIFFRIQNNYFESQINIKYGFQL